MPWAHRSSYAIAEICAGRWPFFVWFSGWAPGGGLIRGGGWAWGLEPADVPFFDAGWVEIVEEATGNLEGVAGVSFGPEFWVAEVQLVHGSGDAHVEQSTFLLEAFGTAFVDDAGVGEHAFGEPDEEDDFPFQAFGLVDAGQGHGIVIRLLFASALGPIAGAGIVGVGE